MSLGRERRAYPNSHLARTGNGCETNVNVGAEGRKVRGGRLCAVGPRKTPGNAYRGRGAEAGAEGAGGAQAGAWRGRVGGGGAELEGARAGAWGGRPSGAA